MNRCLPKGILAYFLLFICVVLVAFLAWANYSPKSPLSVPKSVPEPSPQDAQDQDTQNLVHLKIGDGKEIIVGKYCSQLLTGISRELYESRIASKSPDPRLAPDINGDGKLDFLDQSEVVNNATNEDWCQKNLK